MLQFPIKLKKPHFTLKKPKTRILPKKYTQFSAFIHQKQNYLMYRFAAKLARTPFYPKIPPIIKSCSKCCNIFKVYLTMLGHCALQG